jgi:hypothetical protein
MPAEPVKYIGDKLTVGPIDFSFLPGCVPPIPGTSVLNGPVWIGAGGPPIPVANCMIGPGVGGAGAVSLQVLGVANFLSITNQIGVNNRTGLANVTGFTNKTGASIKAAFSATTGFSAKAAAQVTSGPSYANAFSQTPLAKAAIIEGFVGNTTGINPTQQTALNTKKSFDIKHPTKEGWRLRHVCVEAPTADVYVRGILENCDIIELPEYWSGLVHSETITISVTPIGKYQELSAKLLECNSKIKVSNNLGEVGKYSYLIFGERKDADRNIAEYKGTSVHDYPGDNSQYGINSL